MLSITLIAALGAGLCNATSAVVQRLVAGKPNPKALFSRHFIAGLVTNRWWLIGFGLQVGAFLLQAVALSQGSLVVVEPLLTTDLVFLMLLLHYALKVRVGVREWSAVACIGVGLSVLLLVANPRGGQVQFDTDKWLITVGAAVCLIAIAVVAMRARLPAKLRAGVGGVVSGIVFALVAALTKLTVQQLHYGFLNVLTSWPVYALLVAGIMSIIIMQSTYGAGPLAISQPAIEIVDPFAGVVIGVLLFGDTITHTPLAIGIEATMAGLLVAGIVLMGSSKQILASKT